MHKRPALVLSLLLILELINPGILRSQTRRRSGMRAPTATLNLAESRATHLRRGINLSSWFSQSPGNDYSETHLRTQTTQQDILLIKNLGFDHVRFAVNPAPFTTDSAPVALNADYLKFIDQALDMILAAGLSVIVDIHPSDEFKIKLRTNDHAVSDFAEFWRLFASHLASRDPDRLFLEILNEPMVEDPYRWIGIQARLASAIRKAAPLDTIIATGPQWSAIDQLLLIEPLADPNVIYNFHFYEPHTFSHQGATWGAAYWPYIKNVPYPSSPEAISQLPPVDNESAQKALKEYGAEHWDADRIERMVATAAAWGKAHNVPLTCNEFGVFRRYSPPAARVKWIQDVRTALERHDIGWTMWDYSGSFGVTVRKNGKATPDPLTVEALGLKRTG
jgi:endoglucanase